MIPGPAQPKTVTVCLWKEAPALDRVMEASRGQRSQLVPVRVLTVFRVFVFRVFALPDVDRCCARALGGMAFLMGLVAV